MVISLHFLTTMSVTQQFLQFTCWYCVDGRLLSYDVLLQPQLQRKFPSFFSFCLFAFSLYLLSEMGSWPSGKLPFDCQKNAKNLKSKKKKAIFLKKIQVVGNFLTFKWQFSGGSASHTFSLNSQLKIQKKEA